MSQVISNPFNELLNIMSSQGSQTNTPGIGYGIIKSVQPLLVETQGVILDSNFVSLIERLKPHKRKCKLNGHFDITLDNPYTPQISDYSMPNKVIGLSATASEGSVSINGDLHTHGTHKHTASTLSKVVGNGTFVGGIDFTDYGIAIGDKVLLMCSDDKQSFYVIDKI